MTFRDEDYQYEANARDDYVRELSAEHYDPCADDALEAEFWAEVDAANAFVGPLQHIRTWVETDMLWMVRDIEF
jgi:hypothetical protein